MGPLAALFERKSPAKKQQSTLGVQLPNPTPLPTPKAGYEGTIQRRDFGPRLPSFTFAPPQPAYPPLPVPEAGPSRARHSVPTSSIASRARPSSPEPRPTQTDSLSERVAALRLRRDEPSTSSGARPPPIPPRPFDARTVADSRGGDDNRHLTGRAIASATPLRSSDAEMPLCTGAPSGSAPPAYSPFGDPSPTPRQPATCNVGPPSPTPQYASFSSSRNPFAPLPCPRPPGLSYSTPTLGGDKSDESHSRQKQDPHIQQRRKPGVVSPASLPPRSAAFTGAENSTPSRSVRMASAPTSPFMQRHAQVNSSSPPSTSPRASPNRRKGAGETRRCAGITATSKRCTRMVSLVAWQLSTTSDVPSSPLRPTSSASTPETETEPVYCRQHAKLALADSGCFIARRRSLTTSQESWVTFADWIDESLPVETQALLRHYMTTPISAHDAPGYLYVYELVPREPSSTSATALATTAHIKLGRTIKPVARLSQWRAMCPSREPIVRFVFPRPLTTARSVSNGSPSGQAALKFAESGSTNHHRWERLCLVELAGRAVEGAQAERCTDCGSKHVECFVIERSALSARRDGEWSIERMVQKWERWCRDHAG